MVKLIVAIRIHSFNTKKLTIPSSISPGFDSRPTHYVLKPIGTLWMHRGLMFWSGGGLGGVVVERGRDGPKAGKRALAEELLLFLTIVGFQYHRRMSFRK